MTEARTFRCWSCQGSRLTPVLDLGNTPLANSLVPESALHHTDPVFPLELAWCADCSLVQIIVSVPPKDLFRDYLYFSSYSDTMLQHAESLVGRMIRERALGPNSLVVEVASNDGYLLKFYKRAGVQVLGVEPAVNVARVAVEEHGIPTITEFFGDEIAQTLRAEGKRAAVMHANNVLAHVPDLNGFVRGFKTLLADDGVALFEAPYVRDMVEGCEFDTIYHEHLCYFSLTALDRLFRRNGLVISHVERVPIHGGSLRIFATHGTDARRDGDLHARRGAPRGHRRAPLRGLRARVHRLRGVLTGVLRDLKAAGRTIAAYGASAKGSTLLNAFGIGRDVLDFVVDRSPHKQGLYTAGTHIPIRAPEALATERPDYALLLTWNFADEILAQQKDYLAAGGRFIVPVPQVRIL
ncbi:MAG: class I SAM-dependent methyltransferase [Deltaproteobacteria bacterium]|nr:class I SAM-dependent methyltransferase [Deltaproteobacteria bacterium]